MITSQDELARYTRLPPNNPHIKFMFPMFLFFKIGNWSHIATHLVLTSCLGNLFQKNLLCRFKPGRDEIWQDCSSSKYESIDASDFRYDRQDVAHRSLLHVQRRPPAAAGSSSACDVIGSPIQHSCMRVILCPVFFVGLHWNLKI